MSGKPQITLQLLRVGHCRAPLALTQQGAPWRVESFPAGVAVIGHPQQGMILFDTGYGGRFFEATASFPERLYRWLTPVHLPPSQRLCEHLARLGGRGPDLVILSHFHADHIAGLFEIGADETPVISSAAAVAGLDLGRIASLRAGCPRALRDGLRARALQQIEQFPIWRFTKDELGVFEMGYDILGDGSAIAVPLPGHGLGQFGLYLPQTDGGPAFLIADAAWSVQALRDNRPPPSRTLKKLGDGRSYLRTFDGLRALSDARPELRLIPSHCPQTFTHWGEDA